MTFAILISVGINANFVDFLNKMINYGGLFAFPGFKVYRKINKIYKINRSPGEKYFN